MPRLKCSYREFVAVLEAHGFTIIRHDGSSHRQYRGVVGGAVRFVDIAYHAIGDDISWGRWSR